MFRGRAFARFVALNNLRAELAELKIEKTRLSTAIETFESLLESVEQPVWQRDSEGGWSGSIRPIAMPLKR